MPTKTKTRQKYLVRIEHDPDCESPAEWDGAWTPYSFNPRHVNFKDPDELFPASIGLKRKLKVGTAFMLSYFEHSLGYWYLRGEGHYCPWDYTTTAGILIWEHPPGDMGAKTYEERQRDARGFLEEYSHWCNGWCYGYTIEERRVRKCPRGHKIRQRREIDSCWGFIDNYVLQAVAEALPEDATRQNTSLESDFFQAYQLYEVMKPKGA